MVNNGAGPSKPTKKAMTKKEKDNNFYKFFGIKKVPKAGSEAALAQLENVRIKAQAKAQANAQAKSAAQSKLKATALIKAKKLQNEKAKLNAGKKVLKPTPYTAASVKTAQLHTKVKAKRNDNKANGKVVNNVLNELLANIDSSNSKAKPLNKGKAKMVNNGAGPSKIKNDTLFTAVNMSSNFNNGFYATQNNFGFNNNNGLDGSNVNYGNAPDNNSNSNINNNNNNKKKNGGPKLKQYLKAANFKYYKEGQTEDPIKLLKKSMTKSKSKLTKGKGTKMYKKLGAKQMGTKGGPLELIPVSQIKKSKTAQKIIVPPKKKPVQFMKFNKTVNMDPTKSIPTQPTKMIITADKISDANKILAKKMAWNKMKINNTGENYERYVKNAMNKIMASKSQ